MAQTVKSFGMQTSNTAETPLGDGVEPGNPKGEIYVVNGTSFQVYYEEELPTDHRLLTQVNDALEEIRRQAQTDFNLSAERFITANPYCYGEPVKNSQTFTPIFANLPIIYHDPETDTFTPDVESIVIKLRDDVHNEEGIEEKTRLEKEAIGKVFDELDLNKFTKVGESLYYGVDLNLTEDGKKLTVPPPETGYYYYKHKLDSSTDRDFIKRNERKIRINQS